MAIETGERINVDLDHNCFGCGRLNAYGLQLEFRADARGGVRADFVPADRFEGYTGMVHGGVISAALDEVMAWSLYRHETWAVTAEMTVRFRAPVGVGERTGATGWQVAARGRRIEMAAEIRRERDGTLLATATALFIRVPETQAAVWRERYLAQREGA